MTIAETTVSAARSVETSARTDAGAPLVLALEVYTAVTVGKPDVTAQPTGEELTMLLTPVHVEVM
jgi:hypothetical protein